VRENGARSVCLSDVLARNRFGDGSLENQKAGNDLWVSCFDAPLIFGGRAVVPKGMDSFVRTFVDRPPN
jgi:hypothetical protein